LRDRPHLQSTRDAIIAVAPTTILEQEVPDPRGSILRHRFRDIFVTDAREITIYDGIV
jgi:hypothetical protein